LEDKELITTFFLTGSFIKRYPSIINNLINNQHELANHTYTHPHLTTWSVNAQHQNLESVNREFIYKQLDQTDSLLYKNFHLHFKPYWRAPFGEINKKILMWAAELGYRHIGWSDGCDTWDWVNDTESSLYRKPDEIYTHLMDLEREGKLNGSIILMHLGTDRKNDFPYQMLGKLIDTLREKHYKFLTISQLLSIATPV
jgi:peptidoglycan/xylan/chitin deacetylase (PgdA/CDA1 family)